MGNSDCPHYSWSRLWRAGTRQSGVRWELGENNRVFLKNVNYSVVADSKLPISQAVQNANNETILMSFPVAAWGKDNETAVIDVGRLFTTDIYEFSARQRLNATTMDATRSFVERVSPFPTNIEVEATQTYTRNPTPAGGGGGRARAAAINSSRECRREARPSCCITAWSSCPKTR